MNLCKQILKNHSSIFSVTLSIFVFTAISMPAQAGKIEETAQQTTVQINSEGNGSPGGSGVIIDKQGKTYTVLTANHVVCDAIQGRKQVICTTDVIYTIRTYAGKNYPIKDRQSFQKNENGPDLAIVTFEADENYPVAGLGNSEEIKIGADITISGFPKIFGNEGEKRTYTVTPGKVVTFNPGAVNGYRLVYNATTFIGNSGGPVFDSYGRVIGIHGLADADSINGQSETRSQRQPTIPVKITPVQKPKLGQRETGISTTRSRQQPQPTIPVKITPVKKPRLGQRETGKSSQQKTGFNAGIPINIFLSLTGRKPTTGGMVPQNKGTEIATRGNTGNFPSSIATLEQLLSQGDWKGADKETKSLMLQLAQASGSLNDKAIARLSCTNLTAINQIWQSKSQGRFGFSAQAQKWKSLFGNQFEPNNKNFEDFATDLEWRYRGSYLDNNRLQYSLDAPSGHLPRAFLDGPVWGKFIAYLDGCKIK
jgi:V8-like Glu-specific endopeptidase